MVAMDLIISLLLMFFPLFEITPEIAHPDGILISPSRNIQIPPFANDMHVPTLHIPHSAKPLF
jgi:hypothetical protein